MEHPSIPVKNLWLLMLYASDLAFVDKKAFVAEDNPEELPDLIAALLCGAAESRLRDGLTLGFPVSQDHLPGQRQSKLCDYGLWAVAGQRFGALLLRPDGADTDKSICFGRFDKVPAITAG